METFRDPGSRVDGQDLYIDGTQAADSLSALEGGLIDEVRSRSVEGSDKGKGLSGALGVSGVQVSGNVSKSDRMSYEEEVLRQRTGYSRISALLEKRHDSNAIGLIEVYTPEAYKQIEEGELVRI